MLLESEAALEACCCCFHASLLPATHVLPYVCTLSSQDTPSWAGCSDATYEAERYKQEGEDHGKAGHMLCGVQMFGRRNRRFTSAVPCGHHESSESRGAGLFPGVTEPLGLFSKELLHCRSAPAF